MPNGGESGHVKRQAYSEMKGFMQQSRKAQKEEASKSRYGQKSTVPCMSLRKVGTGGGVNLNHLDASSIESGLS